MRDLSLKGEIIQDLAGSVFIYRKNIVCKSLSQIILETCTQQFVTLDFQECTMKELQMFGFVLLVLCD